jgi:hypothetical protein
LTDIFFKTPALWIALIRRKALSGYLRISPHKSAFGRVLIPATFSTLPNFSTLCPDIRDRAVRIDAPACYLLRLRPAHGVLLAEGQACMWIAPIRPKILSITPFAVHFRVHLTELFLSNSCSNDVLRGHVPNSAQQLLPRSIPRYRLFGIERNALRTAQPGSALRLSSDTASPPTNSLTQILHGLSVILPFPEILEIFFRKPALHGSSVNFWKAVCLGVAQRIVCLTRHIPTLLQNPQNRKTSPRVARHFTL